MLPGRPSRRDPRRFQPLNSPVMLRRRSCEADSVMVISQQQRVSSSSTPMLTRDDTTIVREPETIVCHFFPGTTNSRETLVQIRGRRSDQTNFMSSPA